MLPTFFRKGATLLEVTSYQEKPTYSLVDHASESTRHATHEELVAEGFIPFIPALELQVANKKIEQLGDELTAVNRELHHFKAIAPKPPAPTDEQPTA